MHDSPKRKILGSTNVNVVSDNGLPIAIRDLVIQGSEKLVIGLNITRDCELLNFSGNRIQFLTSDGSRDSLKMFDNGLENYAEISHFPDVVNTTTYSVAV